MPLPARAPSRRGRPRSGAVLARDLPRSPIIIEPDLVGPVGAYCRRTGQTFKGAVQTALLALFTLDRPVPRADEDIDPNGRLRRDGTVSLRVGRPRKEEGTMPKAGSKTTKKAPTKKAGGGKGTKKATPKKAPAKKATAAG